MEVILDIEANSLNNPSSIWLIITKDTNTNLYRIFRNVTQDPDVRNDFLTYAKNIRVLIGHNILGYDIPVLRDLLGCNFDLTYPRVIDTLVISKLVDYSRQGHSIEQYGKEFGIEKGKFNDWTKYSKEMEDYCVRDVDISHKVYSHLHNIISDKTWDNAIQLEQSFQLVLNDLHDHGFAFNTRNANSILDRVNKELAVLDKSILEHFPPKLKLVREVKPTVTKHGTLNRKDFRWVEDGDLSDYNGGDFCKCSWSDFNPSSHKQIIEVLNQAGWKPEEKTQTHIDTERELNRLKYTKGTANVLDLRDKLSIMVKYGWKVNENNLKTLPDKAPAAARTLARRILIESRRRTLTEWLGLVSDSDRIHGKFYGIGTWTHRTSTQKPNTQNIPTDAKLYGKELRSLWTAGRRRLLTGVDAEGIQLRIFAHYIDDKEFIEALVNGRKEEATDPHSLNAAIIGTTREKAKRFIYAYLLGGGTGKLAEILGVPKAQGEEALDRLLERYSGLAYLKREVIPADAQRGFFIGLDGRRVRIPGDTVGQRKHLCMSGYLQNGEAIIMKKAWIKSQEEVLNLGGHLVNMIHDEYVIETPDDHYVAELIRDVICKNIRLTGEELNLKCPMKGDGKIGKNWYEIH